MQRLSFSTSQLTHLEVSGDGCATLVTATTSRGSATLQLAAGREGVVLDTLSLERETDGHSRHGRSLARLSVREAVRLRGLLGKAIATAEAAAIDPPPFPTCGG
jgi:hypothetical protein